MNEQQTKLLRKVTTAIVETVQEMGTQGAPGGPIYAALMTTGMSLEQFEMIMNELVQGKVLRKSGQLYYSVVPKLSAAASSQDSI